MQPCHRKIDLSLPADPPASYLSTGVSQADPALASRHTEVIIPKRIGALLAGEQGMS